MVSCDGPWTGLVMVTAMLVLPFGAPIATAGFLAWRRASSRAAWAATGGALVGLVAWALVVLDHPGDPRWLPLLFVPPLVAGAVAVVRPAPATRGALVAAALVPLVAGLAYAVSLRLAWRPCF